MKKFTEYLEESSMFNAPPPHANFRTDDENDDRHFALRRGKSKRFYPGAWGAVARASSNVQKIIDDLKKQGTKTEVPENSVAKLRNMMKQVDVLLRKLKTSRDLKESCCDGCSEELVLESAEYQGRKVTLNDPIRSDDGKKKFHVYVKNEKGNVIKLGFGDPNMEIRRDDPGARKGFRARHNCDDPGPKWKARYWSCRMWEKGTTVSELD